MATQRYHTASWTNADGSTTAVVLDSFMDSGPRGNSGGWPCASAPTSREAADQLRDLLRWRGRRDSWLAPSDITEPETITLRVEVRPEHELDDRIITFPDTIGLPVACVCARRGDEVRACFIPAMAISFDYLAADELKPLVQQNVQRYVKGLTTRELSRLLRPETVALDEIAVRVDPSKVRETGPSLDALKAAADPMPARGAAAQPAWGRDAEVKDLTRRVEEERGSVLALGPSGVGKSTVIAAAAALARRRRRDAGTLAGPPRYWRTTASRLIAGMKYLGQWQERCERIIDELNRIDGVLVIDNLLELVRVGGEPSQSVAAFFGPYLQHGDLRIIAEATEEELDACRRLLPSLINQLQVLRLEPWPRAAAIDVLARQAQALKERYRIDFEPTAPELIHSLFRRFLPHQSFPGRAVALMHHAFTFARSLERQVDGDVILDRFADATGLPQVMLRDEMPLERAQVFDFLAGRVAGQRQPCELIADLVVTFKAAMNAPGRPLGVVLLCGPTGVGKTETAKALADFLFPHLSEKDRLIRLDMSEYSGPGAVERLTATPAGEPSVFIRRLRRQPFAVLLLDEIEKADPAVFDLLLAVLDEGRLVDTYGRMTDFRSSFLLMTSNIAGDMRGPFGFSRSASVDAQAEALGVFRPEFFNRLDAVVQYSPLDQGTMKEIASLHLGHVARRPGLLSRRLRVRFTDAVTTHMAQVGFDPRYGARPLQRAIEELIVTPLAHQLVLHAARVDREVVIDMSDGKVRMDW